MLLFARLSTGETFIIIFALLMMILLPLIIIAIIVYVLRRNNKHRAIWNSLAPKLNLTMPNPKKLEMSGFYDNCKIKLAVGVRGSGDSSETFTYCVSEFPHSLRFLLNISSPKGLLSKVFDSNDLKLGQVNFDNSFNLKCYDANVLQKLLLSDFPSNKTQNLMGDLMLANQSFGVINVTDEKVYLETSGQIADENIIKQMLEMTTNLANRFRSAREKFPLADWEKQMLQNWQNLAQEKNLQFNSKNIALQGNYKNFLINAALKTDSGKWQTQFKLRFPKSLMIGLKIMPENSIHKAMSWLGLQDIKAEIKEFDEAFIVKAQNIGFAKQLLQPSFCSQLLKLKAPSSDLQITDEEIVITIDSIVGDKNMLKKYLDEIALTAQFFKTSNQI